MTREKRKKSDPRAARLGITGKKKRRRDGTFKEIVYREWLEQATREGVGRADVVLCSDHSIEVVDLTID